MGDRANVVVKESDEQVCLYTHWNGYELPSVLQAALKRGADRIDDFQYITRIIFCDMVRGHENDLTGYGITQKVHDGDRQIITVDLDKTTVAVNEKEPILITDFVKLESVSW
jgi:hypothetical protein